MTGQWYRRIDERDQGRRRLNRLTGWTAAAAVAVAGAFGLALARQNQAAAAPVQQNPVTGDTTDGGVTNPADPGSGGVIQPPAQPPTRTRGRGQVSSGGS
jgi:hypothetical protein